VTKVVVNRTFWLQQDVTYCHYGRDLRIIEGEALVNEIFVGGMLVEERGPADL
jgi:hypothetical protein